MKKELVFKKCQGLNYMPLGLLQPKYGISICLRIVEFRVTSGNLTTATPHKAAI